MVIWAWSFFIGGAFTGDVNECQLEKTKILLMPFAAGFVNLANGKTKRRITRMPQNKEKWRQVAAVQSALRARKIGRSDSHLARPPQPL
jgi:hypothetical protein